MSICDYIYDYEFKSRPDSYNVKRNGIGVEKPIGRLKHIYTGVNLAVYKKIPWYKKWFLNMAFGLVYEKY